MNRKIQMRPDLSISWVNPFPRPSLTRRSTARTFSPRRSAKAPSFPKRRSVGTSKIAVASTNDRTPLDSTSVTPLRWDMTEKDCQHLVKAVKFNNVGLVPAIAQQWDTGEVLMMAWMNADSIRETMKGGRAVYFSRSRQQLWRKGDTSGQIQEVRDILLDCDGDTILLKVDQLGVACHTGRRSCFFTAYRPPDGTPLIVADVLMDPKELYQADKQK